MSMTSEILGDVSGTYPSLTEYGVLGIFVIVLLTFASLAYKRELSRSDRLEAEVLRLNRLIQEKHIPALEHASQALKDASDVLRDLNRQRYVPMERD